MVSQPYSCNLLRGWDFHETTQDHRAVPLTGPRALWSSGQNWISGPQESIAGTEHCMGIWIWPHRLVFLSAERQVASWLAVFPRWDREGRQQDGSWCAASGEEAGVLPPPMVGCFYIIFHRVTVFWECPNSFKMTFLCGLMFLICYNLYYVSTCLNHQPDGTHSGQTLRQLLFRG